MVHRRFMNMKWVLIKRIKTVMLLLKLMRLLSLVTLLLLTKGEGEFLEDKKIYTDFKVISGNATVTLKIKAFLKQKQVLTWTIYQTHRP